MGHRRPTWIRWWLLASFAAACGSPDSGRDAGWQDGDVVQDPGDVGADPDAIPGDTGGDAPPAARTTLACPTPGPLPFVTQAHAFENPETPDLVATYPFRLGANQDFVGGVGQDQVIQGSFVRGESGLVPTMPIAGEWVSLWRSSTDGTWQPLGRVRTGEDGTYAFTLDAADRFGAGTHRVYAVLEGDGSCAGHAVILWPAHSRIVLTDIDGTLTRSDDELFQQLGDPSYDQVEAPSASDLMNAWTGKGYLAVYLTARPHYYRELSLNWLDAHGFPLGLMITSETLTSGDSTTAYKAGELAHASGDLQWQTVAAYGNASTDIAAYEQEGIPKDETFIFGPLGGNAGTVAIPDTGYARHIADYVASRPDAVQPF